MVTIAQRIEALRMQKALSRPALAVALGLPRMSVEKFETGRQTPTKEQYEKLARFFGVSAAYLKGESDDMENMGSWLSGDVAKDSDAPAPAPVQPRKKPDTQAAAKEREDGAVFNLLLKSDVFKAAVLEVLKSPEGQELIKKAARKL